MPAAPPGPPIAHTIRHSRRSHALLVALLLGAGAAFISLQLDPPVAASAVGSVLLTVHANGAGTVAVSPPPTEALGAIDGSRCTASLGGSDPCQFRYPRGTAVTLVATVPAETTFAGWSDDRCPAGVVPTCTLTLDDDEDFVMANFSPQSIDININNPAGTGTITANGVNCDAGCTFPLNTQVTLLATGDNARWRAEACDTTGGTLAAATCTVTVDRRRSLAVGFGTAEVREPAPPEYGAAQLRVVRTGDGSGTVRSQSRSIDCGATCWRKGNLGDVETLVADAAGGSEFAGWSGRGACSGRATTCRVTLGRRLGARFDRAATPPPPPRGVFEARIDGRVTATRRGSRRTISFVLRTNSKARAVGRLMKGGRQIRRKSWLVGLGPTPLKFRVPQRTRRGVYRMKLTVSGTAQPIRRLQGDVRIPR